MISFVNSIGSYINIFESMFANNSAFPMIYIDNAFNVILKSVQCSSSIKNKILTCFHIKNVEKFLMEYSKIINCFSTYETPGLIVESNWYKIKENAQVPNQPFLYYYSLKN